VFILEKKIDIAAAIKTITAISMIENFKDLIL